MNRRAAEIEVINDEEKELKRLRERRIYICVSIVLGLLAICLLVLILPHHVDQVQSTDQKYLDSLGLGALIWGALLAFVALLFLTFSPPDQVVDPEEVTNGTSEDDVRTVLGSYQEASSCWKILSPSGRIAQTCALLGQFALNVTFITLNFIHLPKRDPAQRANMAKHCVTWLEFPMVMVCSVAVLWLFLAVLGSTTHSVPRMLVGALRGGARFSALLALPLANPINAMQEIADIKKTQGIGSAAARALQFCVFVPLAVMAVLVKLSQVDFATEKMVSTWTLFEYVAFAAFINNLAGLRGDVTTGRKLAIFASQNACDPDAYLGVWEENIGATLRKVYGLPLGLVMLTTISVDDLCKLLNPSLRPPKPEALPDTDSDDSSDGLVLCKWDSNV